MKKAANARITVTENGPYLVNGEVTVAEQHIVTSPQGDSEEWREGKQVAHETQFALCRCGHSRNKPFCDGTHVTIGFDGAETASRESFAKLAKEFVGPTMVLKDADSLCAFARFCDAHGRIWNLIRQTDTAEGRKLVEHEAGHCPAGRLVAVDRKTGREFEPDFEPSIGLVEDTEKKVSGPLWVRGGIPVVAADGHEYEVRNRVTLCRCGRSANKPFCDGAHAD
jgi:CDGSH-type Zn-finger protein